AVIVNAAFPPPVVDAGLNTAVAPAGRPVTLRFTTPVNPFTAVTCAVQAPLPPAGLAAITKSAAPEVASGPVMLTLSNTAAFSFVLSCDVTARPAYTVPLNPTETVFPI